MKEFFTKIYNHKYVNKYTIVLAFFLIWIIIYDNNSIMQHLKYDAEISELDERKQFYKNKIKVNREKLEGLKKNPEELERLAREKYWMKKDNEDVFIIEENEEE